MRLKLALSILLSPWLCVEEIIEFDDCCRQQHKLIGKNS